HAAMVRSPYPHAIIKSYDTEAARAAPGVIAVLTGADFHADGLGRIPHVPMHSSPPDALFENRDGSEIFIPHHFPLPHDKARYVGEAVAVVVAETRDQAWDAAALVVVDYEELPAVIGTRAAAEEGAPMVWQGAPMEPRATNTSFDPDTGRYTVYAGSGGVTRQKRELAAILGVEADKVRVITRDVGGNFGTRNAFYVEEAIVAWAARRTGRAVKWRGDRTEIFLTDCQARDLAVDAELAFDKDGHILALRSTNIGNIGAHTISFIPVTKGVEIMSLTYAIPACFVTAKAVLSNTPSTYPYRSAGRPEVTYVMERLIDMAAEDLGIDRVELRRRNLVPVSALPYDNKLGMIYDSGEFEANMNIAARIGDWAGFEARRAEARTRGRLRGIGVSNYIDLSTGVPMERSEIEVQHEHERLEVVIGTVDSGQGHATSFGQVVSELLGVALEDIDLVQGDTDRVSVGGGTHSGRSMRMGTIVIKQASDEIIDRGKRIAAHVLEAAEADIDFADGAFTVAGTDRSLGLFEAAAAAENGAGLPDDLQGSLRADAEILFPRAVFGNGTQMVEVEVDVETGAVEIVRYAAVDDVGRAINPMLIHGQTHGGIAQGVGQALMEDCAYDYETGQMQAATFMDYAMPRADHFPYFDTEITEVPSDANPFGIKPGSEGGTAPAPAVVVNAIVDALRELGVRHIDLPASPQRVWRAIQDAKA
ncbi:MAG: xanthine dehydrogenase family protein molybdopterin-binding subunit, partial [Alphaproteobacteria bacterium]